MRLYLEQDLGRVNEAPPMVHRKFLHMCTRRCGHLDVGGLWRGYPPPLHVKKHDLRQPDAPHGCAVKAHERRHAPRGHEDLTVEGDLAAGPGLTAARGREGLEMRAATSQDSQQLPWDSATRCQRAKRLLWRH